MTKFDQIKHGLDDENKIFGKRESRDFRITCFIVFFLWRPFSHIDHFCSAINHIPFVIKFHRYSFTLSNSKMTFWREAGLTYLRYSSVAASALRKVVRADKVKIDPNRETSTIRVSGPKKQAQSWFPHNLCSSNVRQFDRTLPIKSLWIILKFDVKLCYKCRLLSKF